MKILALADIHGREDVVYLAQELYGIYNFDLIAIAGDITDYGPWAVAENIIDNMPTRTLAIPGNCDPPEVIDSINNSAGTNLHKRISSVKGYTFAGLGGVNGGFNMGIVFTDDEATSLLSTCSGCIFLVHQPPYGILDTTASGAHLGSMGILRAVQQAKPTLVISGHVHEARGYMKKDDTIFINPGPAKHGYAAIVDLNTGNVELIER